MRMYNQAKQIGGSAVITLTIIAALSLVYDIQAQFGMYGPFDPVFELLSTVPLTAFGLLGIASLLAVYKRVTGFLSH